jgi:hypothetical protein
MMSSHSFRIAERLARVRRALEEISYTQTRLLEVRTGVPMQRPAQRRAHGSQIDELELLYRHPPAGAPHH